MEMLLEYHVKARSIVNLIDKYQAELVALVEVKNRDCVELAQKNLNHKESWQIVFLEGLDTFTGQDVVVPSKFPVIKETVTNFPDQWSNYIYQEKSKSVRLYKDCELSIHGQSVYLNCKLTYVSKRSDNDAKRLGQAKVVRQQSIRALEKDQNLILMWYFNDFLILLFCKNYARNSINGLNLFKRRKLFHSVNVIPTFIKVRNNYWIIFC